MEYCRLIYAISLGSEAYKLNRPLYLYFPLLFRRSCSRIWKGLLDPKEQLGSQELEQGVHKAGTQ